MGSILSVAFGISFLIISFSLYRHSKRVTASTPFLPVAQWLCIFVAICSICRFQEALLLQWPFYVNTTKYKITVYVLSSVLLFWLIRLKPALNLALKKSSKLRDIEKKAEKKFRDLLEGAPDAQVISNFEGKIVLVNAQALRLFGYSREELMDKQSSILIPGLFLGHLKTTHGKPRPLSGVRGVGMRSDGSEFPAEISLAPLGTDDGVLISYVVRDITETVRLEKQLSNISRLKSEFLTNISHELRSPLNAIMGFTMLLKEEKPGPLNDCQKDYLTDITSSSRHLLQLINNLLELGKIEAGKIDFNPQSTDIVKLVTEVRDVLVGLAMDKNITISIDVQPDLSYVIVDQNKLKQVLYNYLSNGIKFSRDGGRIKLQITKDMQGTLRIDVEDNGIGIEPENITKLFCEFQQFNSGSKVENVGTGLGLALTKKIVEAQGGRVSVSSTKGAGSVFSAFIPSQQTYTEIIPN